MGSSNSGCSSPRCQNRSGSGDFCSKHGHYYSWWCKYCSKEDDERYKQEIKRNWQEGINRRIQNEREEREAEREYNQSHPPPSCTYSQTNYDNNNYSGGGHAEGGY